MCRLRLQNLKIALGLELACLFSSMTHGSANISIIDHLEKLSILRISKVTSNVHISSNVIEPTLDACCSSTWYKELELCDDLFKVHSVLENYLCQFLIVMLVPG